MAAVISVPFDQLWEGLQEGCNEQGPWAIRKFRMAWSNRRQFALDMRGYSRTTGPGAPWVKRTPFGYPDPASGVILYAKDLVIDPAGDIVVGSDPIAFEWAIATVNFGLLSYTVDFEENDPFLLASISQDPTENESLQWASQEVGYTTEWYEPPNSSVKWKSDNKKINRKLRRPVTVHRMSITWNHYPVMPMTTLRLYADSLNDATFLGCAKGTVYLEGPEIARDQTTDGTITQKVRLNLKWRQFDWNKDVREDGFTWDVVVDSASGNELLPYRDFSKLLL